MAFTQTHLDELKNAYAQGATRVVHDGKAVEYGSEADMLRRIRLVESELEKTNGNSSTMSTFAGFNRG